jgi:hypothetical protein
MKTPNSNRTKALATALMGAASLFTAAGGHAAFSLVPYGGTLNLSGTAGTPPGGDVKDSKQVAFTDTANPTFTGFLRSIVVDADGAGPGTNLDFYYQIENVSTLGTPASDYDIISFALQQGFGTGNNVQADWLSSLGTLGGETLLFVPKVPTAGKTVYQATREFVPTDGAGFTFDSDLGLPDTNPPFNNIGKGQVSNWLVLRTTASTWTSVSSAIGYGLGAATPDAPSFAPVPEPSSVLLGLVGLGVFAGRRFRKSSAQQKS